MADIRKGVAVAEEMAPGAIVAASIDGADFYLRPEPGGQALDRSTESEQAADVGQAWNGQSQIDLVQCYDEYIMGYSVSRHYFGGTAPAYPFGDTPMHVVLSDGVLAGAWRHSLVRRGQKVARCELDIRLSRPLGHATEQALEVAVARYGAFLGVPAVRSRHKGRGPVLPQD
jgi:hypothetical protein